MGHLDHLVAPSLASMEKHHIKTRICKILSKRQNDPARLYLVTAGIRVFRQNIRGLIVAGILPALLQ
jgi:hypothetical protein